MNIWKRSGMIIGIGLLIGSLLVSVVAAGEAAAPEKSVGGLTFLETASRKDDLPEQPFLLTKVYDYNTGATLGRCYAPADYQLNINLMFAGDGYSDCSAAVPYQLGIAAVSPDNRVNMFYKSRMSYLYLPNEYQEGQNYGGREVMLKPMTAGEYADYMVLRLGANATEITRESAVCSSDEDNAFLAEQSDYYLHYMNPGFDVGLDIRVDEVISTSADVTYRREENGQVYKTRIITMTNQLQYMLYGVAVSLLEVETYIPYIYVLTATEDTFDEAEKAFELFVANSRVTDEFQVLNTLRSQDLISILSFGYPVYADLDEAAASILGYDYGTYDTEEFCDYIKDQNEYTTSDGRSFKVPTSYDYVYEGDDGTIYATNTAEQPAGSIRLYANGS